MCRKGSTVWAKAYDKKIPPQKPMSSLNLPKPSLVMPDCQLHGRLRQEDGNSKVSLRKLVFQNKKQKEDWGYDVMAGGLPGMCEALGSSPLQPTRGCCLGESLNTVSVFHSFVTAIKRKRKAETEKSLGTWHSGKCFPQEHEDLGSNAYKSHKARNGSGTHL